ALMLGSALLIHLTGGRIEMHFHVFGSLTFLAFYRDWRVLVTGSVVIALDHLVRGYYWPQSAYGVPGGAEWRWVEHGAWIVFLDFSLTLSCLQSCREMQAGAERQALVEATNQDLEKAMALVEATNQGIEQTVQERTAALRASEERFRLITETIEDVFWM